MWLTKLAINRPIFILMLVLGSIVLGGMALNSMRVELQPEVSFPAVTVLVAYPGAGPEEVETLVARKVEDAISSAAGLRELTSTSQEGAAIIVAIFNVGTDVEVAFNDVRAKVEAIRSDLPRDALAPTIQKFETTSEPIMYMTVSSTRPSSELRDLADRVLKDRFSRIDGVGAIAVTGGDQREIQVSVSREKLIAYGLPITQVWNAIRAANYNVPAGRSIEGNREYTVRIYGEFRTIDELRNLRIQLQNRDNPMAKGPVIRLSDIAEVTDSVAEITTESRLNGNDSIALVFQKQSQGNAVEISKAVKLEIEELKKEYPDLVFTTIDDQAKLVEESLTDLKVSLYVGIALVVGIIFLFLHNLRGTIIVAIAIPTCVLATFMLIKALGFTLNTMTMLGISLAIGILVDDAIVVLENIYRHLTLGEPPPQAALNGRMEIGLAAIVITLVDVVVFIPIALMGGVVGQFFRSFGITVATATLLSLFVSFTVTPMLAARWYRSGDQIEHVSGFFALFERVWAACTRAYRVSLAAALRHRWLTVFLGAGVLFSVFFLITGSFMTSYAASAGVVSAIAMYLLGVAAVLALISVLRRRVEWLRAGALFAMWAGMFAASMLFGTFLGQMKGQPIFQFRFAPSSDTANVSINMLFPAGTSLESTRREVERVEAIAMATKDVKYVFSSIGSTASGFFGSGESGSQVAQLRVVLNDKRSFGEQLLGRTGPDIRVRPDTIVADELREKIGRIPDCTLTVSAVSGWGFGAPIIISLYGQDARLVQESAEKVRDALSQIPGVVDADISTKPGKPEIRAYVDRTRMADLGVSVEELGSAMRIAYEGDDTIKFRENGQEYPIRVRLSEKDRNVVRLVDTVPVAFSQNGGLLTLRDLTTPRSAFGPTKITRRDKQREVQVTAQLLPGYNPGSMQRVIDSKLAELNLPPEGVTKAWQGENRVMGDEQGYLFRALLLSLILVYMLMASLFDNLLYPFIIMLSQPQALAGALLSLIVTGYELNIVGFIGIIMLVGLVGKNAILLVDYTNTLRKRGRGREEALIEAGPIRLRPISMTTLALVLAMLPIALALGRGSEFRATLGIIIIGGMTLSTLLTLLVIPCSYTIVDDFSNWLGRKVFRRRESAPIQV